MSTVASKPTITVTNGDFTWAEVDILPYKEDGTHFKSITRQVLFRGENDLPVEFRYFEVGPGGHSTLERHLHQHAVMIIRGSGEVFVGDSITPVRCQDVVHVPPMTWHQFRATQGEELGFLCVVATERDRPQRPGSTEIDDLKRIANVADFIRY
jgi:mannose-6-phosphate isomerase-like protein (cupin superfamily)